MLNQNLHTERKQPRESTESVEEGVGAFAASVDSPQGGKWLIDSGASSHMTPDMEFLSNYREFEKPEKVSLGDGRTVNAIGVGDVHVKMEFRVSEPKYSVMYQVLHVPKLACNQFSVRAAAAKGNFVRSRRKLQLIHSDVCGPMPTESIGGQKYFVTFIDDYSRCCAVYFLKHKSEVFGKFKEYEARVTNDSGQPIGTLRSDNGDEYLTKEFRSYLKVKGIRHALTS